MEKKMNYPKNIVSRLQQHIEETSRKQLNPTNVWNQWEQFDKWEQGSEWSEVNAPKE